MPFDRQAVVAEGIFPGDLWSTLRVFRGLHLQRGDSWLPGVSEDREAGPRPRPAAAAGSRPERRGVRATQASRPSRFPSTGGNWSLCSAPPPPRVASGNRAYSEICRGPGDRDGAWRSGAPRAAPGRAALAAPSSLHPAPRRPPCGRPPFRLFVAAGAGPGRLQRPRATGPRARAQRRHHVSGPDWRGRSGPSPAPRARARSSGGAGPRTHPTPGQLGPGFPGARGCLLQVGAMGPLWERKGKTRRLCGPLLSVPAGTGGRLILLGPMRVEMDTRTPAPPLPVSVADVEGVILGAAVSKSPFSERDAQKMGISAEGH